MWQRETHHPVGVHFCFWKSDDLSIRKHIGRGACYLANYLFYKAFCVSWRISTFGSLGAHKHTSREQACDLRRGGCFGESMLPGERS